MKTILCIAHGSKNIGMGHVMRTVSLANAFRMKKWKVTFFSKYQLGREYIEQQKFSVIGNCEAEKEDTGFSYGEAEELGKEWKLLEEMLIKQPVDVILVDSYNVSNEYFRLLRQYAKCLVYVDDLAAFSYEVDVVLNYNVSAFSMGYENLLKGPVLLAGVSYCPLREEFLNMPVREGKDAVTDLLITTGGADPKNVTGQLIFLCEKYAPDCRLHVVVGKAFVYKAQLYELQQQNRNIMLYENPEKMSEVMLRCDMAITAGGSTMYELAACGIPMFSFIYAENQRPAVEWLEQEGYVVNLGEYLGIKESFPEKFVEFYKDDVWRKKMSIRLQKLVDGCGAKRVADAVEGLM